MAQYKSVDEMVWKMSEWKFIFKYFITKKVKNIFSKPKSVKITQKMLENSYLLNNKSMSFSLPAKDGSTYLVDCKIRKVQKIYGESPALKYIKDSIIKEKTETLKQYQIPNWGWFD